jgi:hypothetical protein
LCIIAQIIVYIKYERFLNSQSLDVFQNAKIKLRLAFALFMILLISRTIYFVIENSNLYFGESDQRIMHFEEQIYIYLSENLFSSIIVIFLMKVYLKGSGGYPRSESLLSRKDDVTIISGDSTEGKAKV